MQNFAVQLMSVLLAGYHKEIHAVITEDDLSHTAKNSFSASENSIL